MASLIFTPPTTTIKQTFAKNIKRIPIAVTLLNTAKSIKF